eukprot:TRINITY_DN31745_c0_g1_i1.p1 TRINITY_DN31745_c0_g1~~TRINITY_DN31745_c0_g1_i1.p1  ORF type:complete len:508 (+),score=46.29 TRINITY_DN31745_c0_g1_i1:40-1563(+)
MDLRGRKRKAEDVIACPLYSKCKAFVQEHLVNACGLKALYLDPSQDKCFCRSCEPSAGQLFRRGNPPERYALPEGWCRFGIAVDSVFAQAERAWEDWHVSFHGTSDRAIASILRHRYLLMPGDVLDDGTRLGIRDGHIHGEVGFFTSPTIRYAELDAYATPIIWKGHAAKIVLQLRQKPGSYTTQGETVGWASMHGSTRIDSHFTNAEVERKSLFRGSVLLYGLLVRIDSRVDCVESHFIVEWCGRTLGRCRVGRDCVAKCAESEFIKTGDSVKATQRLFFTDRGDDKGCHVEKNDLGIVNRLEGSQFIVEWSGRALGLCIVEQGHVAKCAEIEYIKVGDLLKAVGRLTFACGDEKGCDVNQNDLGILKQFDGSKLLVEWIGRSLGLCTLEPGYAIKCHRSEYIQVGDVVKAARRLTFAHGDDIGCHVEKDSLGTVKQLDGSKLIVEWIGRAIGLCTVAFDEATQCFETEYIKVGDLVKATRCLSFDASDGRGCVVNEGDLGILQGM